MDISTIDPTFAELGPRLAETAVRNTASAINARIQALTARKDNQQTNAELQEIIYSLISDRDDLLRIAKAYEQELIAQQISPANITYINNTLVPVLKQLATKTGDSSTGAQIDALAPLLSVETLTVLQLLGFNFKRAIGEPLTLLLQQFITSRMPLDPHISLEHARLNAAVNVELLKVTQDAEATARCERLLKTWHGRQ